MPQERAERWKQGRNPLPVVLGHSWRHVSFWKCAPFSWQHTWIHSPALWLFRGRCHFSEHYPCPWGWRPTADTGPCNTHILWPCPLLSVVLRTRDQRVCLVRPLSLSLLWFRIITQILVLWPSHFRCMRITKSSWERKSPVLRLWWTPETFIFSRHLREVLM